MSSRFTVLRSSEGDSDSNNDDNKNNEASVPSYEDLSLIRVDEETVLTAVYGDDFSREDGPWGSAILSVKIRPPDMEESKIGTELV